MDDQTPKYRIYAKIIGPVLPSVESKVGDCTIKPMSLAEQRKRKFKPLESADPKQDKDFYKSYLTHRRVVDPRIVKTEHVIFIDVPESRIGTALGVAIQNFEKVTGVLAVSASIRYAEKHDVKSRYINYEYQICRIYKLSDNLEIEPEEEVFDGGHTSHMNLPSDTDFGLLNNQMLQRMLMSKDGVFIKALGYLQSGEKGFHNNTHPEKMTLDFMKCIELIVDQCEGKSFNEKLKNAVKEFGIDADDYKSIKKLWALRSNGDVAHAKLRSRQNSLPPQYPVPSIVDGPYIDSGSLAVRFLTQYFLFRDSIISIKISSRPDGDEDVLVDVNYGLVYTIKPSVKDWRKLTPFLKKKISTHFKVPIKDIKLYASQAELVHFRISNHLKHDLHENHISHKRIII